MSSHAAIRYSPYAHVSWLIVWAVACLGSSSALAQSSQDVMTEAGQRVGEAALVSHAVAWEMPIDLAPDRRAAWEAWLLNQAVGTLEKRGRDRTSSPLMPTKALVSWLGPLQGTAAYALVAPDDRARREAVAMRTLMGRGAEPDSPAYQPFDGAVSTTFCSEVTRSRPVEDEPTLSVVEDAVEGASVYEPTHEPTYKVFDGEVFGGRQRRWDPAEPYAPFDGPLPRPVDREELLADDGSGALRAGSASHSGCGAPWHHVTRDDLDGCMHPTGYWPFDVPVRCTLATTAELDVVPLRHPVSGALRDAAIEVRGERWTVVTPEPLHTIRAVSDKAKLIELRVANSAGPFSAPASVERVIVALLESTYAQRSHVAWLMSEVCYPEQPCEAYAVQVGDGAREVLVMIHAQPADRVASIALGGWVYRMQQALGGGS